MGIEEARHSGGIRYFQEFWKILHAGGLPYQARRCIKGDTLDARPCGASRPQADATSLAVDTVCWHGCRLGLTKVAQIN